MFSSLDELLDAEGADLGWTSWQRISQDDVQRFADATRAHEWIHVDVDRAKNEGPFGTTVAHGYLTLSLATCFITELLVLPGAIGVNYGLNRVRFPAPVPVGSRVRAHGLLHSAERKGPGVQTVVELTYETDAHDSAPCVAEVVSLAVPG